MERSERELLDILANHVRLLALTQIARMWFAGRRKADRHAENLSERLASAGWLRVSEILARPIRRLSAPLCEWQHAEPAPDFWELSRRLHQRASSPAALTTVVRATAKTCALFGIRRSSPAPVKLTQATHDLHVGEVFLTFARRGLPPGVSWVGEDVLPLTWPIQQRPDAVLVNSTGELVGAIEYGGDYPQQRLADLHHGLASIPLPYEIW